MNVALCYPNNMTTIQAKPTVTVAVSKDNRPTWTAVREIAFEERRSISEIVNEAVREWVDRRVKP